MWIIREKNSKVVIKTTEVPIRADFKVPIDLDPSLEILITLEEPLPVCDFDTQKAIRTQREVPGDAEDDPIKLISGWTIVPLTEEELVERAALARRNFPAAETWKIKIWMAKQGINPEAVPLMIEQLFAGNTEAIIEAKARWNNVPFCPRDHPLVAAIGNALGMDSAAVDAAWPAVLAIV